MVPFRPPPGSFRHGGSDRPAAPRSDSRHLVRRRWLRSDRHEVTNAQCERFVDATGYVTLPERGVAPKSPRGPERRSKAACSRCFVRPVKYGRDMNAGGGNTSQRREPGAIRKARARQRGSREPSPRRAVRLRGRAGLPHGSAAILPTERNWECLPPAGGAGSPTSPRLDGRNSTRPHPIANTWAGRSFPYDTAAGRPSRHRARGCFHRTATPLRQSRQRVGSDEVLVSAGPCAEGGCPAIQTRNLKPRRF